MVQKRRRNQKYIKQGGVLSPDVKEKLKALINSTSDGDLLDTLLVVIPTFEIDGKELNEWVGKYAAEVDIPMLRDLVLRELDTLNDDDVGRSVSVDSVNMFIKNKVNEIFAADPERQGLMETFYKQVYNREGIMEVIILLNAFTTEESLGPPPPSGGKRNKRRKRKSRKTKKSRKSKKRTKKSRKSRTSRVSRRGKRSRVVSRKGGILKKITGSTAKIEPPFDWQKYDILVNKSDPNVTVVFHSWGGRSDRTDGFDNFQAYAYEPDPSTYTLGYQTNDYELTNPRKTAPFFRRY